MFTPLPCYPTQPCPSAPMISALLNPPTPYHEWIDLPLHYRETAYYLQQLGWVTLREHVLVKCANPYDTKDWPHVINPNCDNVLRIHNDFNERCDDLLCEDCGRTILPNTFQKRRFNALSVQIHKQSIVNWFETHLTTAVESWRKPTEGVYHFFRNQHVLTLILPEFCTELHYQANGHLTIAATHAQNVPATTVADILCDPDALQNLIRQMAKALPMSTPINYVPLNTHAIPMQPCLLEVRHSAIYINNVEIIPKHANAKLSVFNILLKQFLRDYETGNHTYLTVNAIADQMENVIDVEQQVRRVINRLQLSIAKRLDTVMDIEIDRNTIIESERGGGYYKKDYGYRFNPKTLLLNSKVSVI